MTDLPPPVAGNTPPPPPPPPDLVAPPGAVGVTASPMTSVRLERVGKLATATIVLAVIAAVLGLVTAWASQAAQDDAAAFLAGTIDSDTFVERAAPFLLMTTVQGVITAATAVVTMIWMYRMAKNHRALRRNGTWGPGWAIGGWFLPPLVYVIPTLMFRELWRASDPEVPIGGDWKRGPTSPLIWLWFLLYCVGPLGVTIAQNANGFSLGASEQDLAQQVIDNEISTLIGSSLTVAATGVFVLFVRQLTSRHRRLTGEAELG